MIGEPVLEKVKVRTVLIRRKSNAVEEQEVRVLYSSKNFLVVKLECGIEQSVPMASQRHSPVLFYKQSLENE